MSPLLSPGDIIRHLPNSPLGDGIRIVVEGEFGPAVWTKFGKVHLAGFEAYFTILPRAWEQSLPHFPLHQPKD